MQDNEPTEKLMAYFAYIGQQPLAWLSERSIYQALAERGLTIFDKSQKPYRDIQAQWQPIMDMLDSEPQSTDKIDAKAENKAEAKTSSKKSKNSSWYE